jgi:hypothetical protein
MQDLPDRRARAGSWDAKVSSAADGFAVLFKTPRCPFFRAFHEDFPYHQTKAARRGEPWRAILHLIFATELPDYFKARRDGLAKFTLVRRYVRKKHFGKC